MDRRWKTWRAIADIDLNKRKVILSIKLEEIEKKEALDKYGSEDSGKNLPFSSLSEDLKKKEEEKKKIEDLKIGNCKI